MSVIARVFEKIYEYNDRSVEELFIDYMINNIIWGNFESEDEALARFGSVSFFIPIKQSHVLFACTTLERVVLVDKDGTVRAQG